MPLPAATEVPLKTSFQLSRCLSKHSHSLHKQLTPKPLSIVAACMYLTTVRRDDGLWRQIIHLWNWHTTLLHRTNHLPVSDSIEMNRRVCL